MRMLLGVVLIAAMLLIGCGESKPTITQPTTFEPPPKTGPVGVDFAPGQGGEAPKAPPATFQP